MNPGLDGDYKGLENAANLNMVRRNGDHSNSYASDAALRAFQKDQRSPFNDLPPYGCIPPPHPTLAPRFTGLGQLLPSTSSMYPPAAFCQYEMLSFLQRSCLDVPRDVSTYVDRRNNLNQSYPAQSHMGLGQSSSTRKPYQEYHKSDANSGIYGRYAASYNSNSFEFAKKAMESDSHLASRLTPHPDPYPHFLGSYPRSASSHVDSGKKYTVPETNAYASVIPQNGIKSAGPSVIDLTNSNSPDIHTSSIPRRDSIPREHSAPPFFARESRSTPKENGSLLQSDTLKGWNSSRRSQPAVGPYSGSSMSPYNSLLGIPPSVHSIPPFNQVESSINEVSRSKTLDSGLIKQGSTQWPHSTRLHTPSPRQFGVVDSVTKNSPTSLPFKSKPVPLTASSEITFNYPEGSGAKQDKPQPINKHLGNGVVPQKPQMWSKKDESKLSPYENHIMDSARDGKPCPNFGRFDTVPHVHQRYQQPNRSLPLPNGSHTIARSNPPPDYVPPHTQPSQLLPQTKSEAEIARNSVIHSVPKLLAQLEGPALSSMPPTDNHLPLDNKVKMNSTSPNCPPIEVEDGKEKNEAPSAEHKLKLEEKSSSVENTPSKPGRKRKSSNSKDGEQRQKRQYIKRSDIWRKKELQKLEKKRGKLGEKDSPNEQVTTYEPEQKDSPEKKVEPAPAQIEKSSRPQRRSGGIDMDEMYLYGWYTDEETENDDSSDEDYNCTTKVNKFRSRGVAKSLRQRRRLSSCRYECGEYRARKSSRDEDFPDYGESNYNLKRRTRKRGRRPGLRIKSEESTPEKPEKVEEKDEKAENIESQQEDILGNQKQENQKDKEDSLNSQPDDSHTVLCDKTGDLIIAPNVADKMSYQDLPVDTEPVVRKKRKYTRRRDKDGRPIKKMRKVVKSVERIPEKKRKYTKTSEKWFKKKTPEKALSKKLDDADVPPFFPPALEVGPDAKEKEMEIHLKQENTSQQRDQSTEKDYAEVVEDESTKPADLNSSLALDDKLTQEGPKSPENKIKTSSQGAQTEDIAARYAALSSDQTPVKIRKKPGRKPGWRKYPQGINPNLPNNAKGVLKKKYKKPKGDGLCRFGMRKRGRRPKLRLNVPAANLRTTATTVIGQTPTKSEPTGQNGQVKQKRKYNNASRLEKKRLRLLRMGGVTPEKKDKASTSESSSPKNKSLTHKISEELQSQEYEYDFKSLSFFTEAKQNDEEIETVTEQNAEDEDSEQSSQSTAIQSRPQTPTSGMQISGTPITPFPSYLKKLCCNSAIGETPLHKAARMCYMDNLQYYLESGTNVNQSDNAGYTALHEACVHNHLEAASLLLQYSADVNKYAVDGTRPIHDAVEYDRLEMVRLVLASGADPMLNKFSGRSIPNMIRSDNMRKFLEAYLRELKELKDSDLDDKVLEWKFPCSAVFDKSLPHHYNALDFAPDAEEMSIDFEMYEEEPIITYLLQPDEESERANYCLLDDYMNATKNKLGRSGNSIRVITMPVEKFRAQIRQNKLQSLQYERRRPKPDLSGDFVELVAVDNDLNRLIGAETIQIPLFENCKFLNDNQNMLSQSHEEDRTSSFNRTTEERHGSVKDGDTSVISEEILPTELKHDSLKNSNSHTCRFNGEIENDLRENATKDTHIERECTKRDLSSCQNRVASRELSSKLFDAKSDMAKSTAVDKVR